MVKVTDKDYYLDGFAEQVCQAVAKRVQSRKQDILILMNGNEGSGKTNASIALAYRIADLTGREFGNENVFFNIDKMMEYAGNTKEKVIIWDEAALGGLASSWSAPSQRKLKAMLMVCRKLRHVFLFNIPRFYRLNRDLIERAYCMFNIYEDKEEKPGNFMFYGRQKLEYLYQDWKKKGRANYWMYKKVHGHFAWVLPKLIDEEAYEKEKDKAITTLVNTTKEKVVTKKDIKMEVEAQMIARAKKHGLSDEILGIIINKSPRTVYERKKLLLEKPVTV